MMRAENTMDAVAVSSDGSACCISPITKVRRQVGVVLCHVNEKHMLVPAMTNKVDLDSLFLLNETGAFIWEQLNGYRHVVELGKAMAKAFGIECDAATQDVVLFLSSLHEHRLVELAGGW